MFNAETKFLKTFFIRVLGGPPQSTDGLDVSGRETGRLETYRGGRRAKGNSGERVGLEDNAQKDVRTRAEYPRGWGSERKSGHTLRDS